MRSPAAAASQIFSRGYALRFPRILRVRDDKPVGEIDTLETVAALYARQGWEERTERR